MDDIKADGWALFKGNRNIKADLFLNFIKPAYPDALVNANKGNYILVKYYNGDTPACSYINNIKQYFHVVDYGEFQVPEELENAMKTVISQVPEILINGERHVLLKNIQDLNEGLATAKLAELVKSDASAVDALIEQLAGKNFIRLKNQDGTLADIYRLALLFF